MKFQVTIEVDERQAKMSQREIIDLVVGVLGDALEETGAYFDCGVNLENVVSGMTN